MIGELVERCERAALMACHEAEEAGQEPPRLLTVNAVAEGYVTDFLAPVRAMHEVREAIISAGGAYRVSGV